jgi:hypothetical protein
VKDCEVIEAFVAFLRAQGHPGLRVDSRPEQTNRKSPEIDAIAGTFAIEHTSVDTLLNQRRDADWFTQVVGGLEAELAISPACRVSITLEYHGVHPGQDWLAIRQALKIWITRAVPYLSDGRHVVEEIPGVPFRLHVAKASERPPGLSFTRYEPLDDTLSARIRRQFDRKAHKPAKYQGTGKTTVLLVENADLALMNDQKMLDAIRRAYPDGLPIGVDRLWYADTAIPDDIDFRDFTPMLGGAVAQQHD